MMIMKKHTVSNSHPVVDLVIWLFRERGDSQYGGEAVTQAEHALQTAYFASQAGSSACLVAAALMHDIGHLLHELPHDAPEHGIDDVHETLAANWLQSHFPSEVVEPVRMHVNAKRYLCAVEPEYARQLSPPSLLSLQLQGGPMDAKEVADFRTSPHFEAAVRLRRWDDAAKIPRLEVPELESYRSVLEQACREIPD